MINQILVLNFSDIWSFWLYGQLHQDKTLDHISETRAQFYKNVSSRKAATGVFQEDMQTPVSSGEASTVREGNQLNHS